MQYRRAGATALWQSTQIAAPAAADAIVAVVAILVVAFRLQEIENLSGQRSKNERRHEVDPHERLISPRRDLSCRSYLFSPARVRVN